MNAAFQALSKGDQALYLRLKKAMTYKDGPGVVVLQQMYRSAKDETLRGYISKTYTKFYGKDLGKVKLTHKNMGAIDVTGLEECPVCNIKKADLELYFGVLEDPNGTCQKCHKELSEDEGRVCHWVCYHCYKEWKESMDPYVCSCGKPKGPDYAVCFSCHTDNGWTSQECPPDR